MRLGHLGQWTSDNLKRGGLGWVGVVSTDADMIARVFSRFDAWLFTGAGSFA